MKNNIIKISLILFATLLSYSCNDEFLDRQPLDEISNESYWNTENDLLVYNNGLYHLAAQNDNNVPIMMGHDDGFNSHRWGVWHLSGFSDDTAPRHPRHTEYQRKRAGKHQVQPGAAWFGYRGWNFLRAVNVGMDNYDRAEVSEEVRNKYIGEARMFRAWFYHDKVSKFGDVQWVESELNVDDDEILYGERDDREFVMEKVLEDINFATQNMPNEWGDGASPGRINRWGALLLKSRICLFEGTWRKYHGGSNPEMWLQEAADAAQELITDGPYSLHMTGDTTMDYNAIHRMTNSELSGNPEVIYWRRYELGILTNHVQSYHRGYNGGATKSLVEDYLCADGLPISLSPLYQGDEVYEDIFVDRDPRLRQTVLHPDDQAIYRYGNHDFDVSRYPLVQGMTNTGQKSYTGYHLIKVYDVNSAHATYNTSETPAIVMRLGEALLNFAEAKAELGTITQADLDMSINQLRERVGMPDLTLNPPMDPRYADDGVSALIVEIRRERRIELFMEGFRYDDLRRWKLGKRLREKDYGMRWDEANRNRIDPNGEATVLTSTVDGVEYLDVYKGTDFETPEFDENKHYLWPIPINSISQNPNLGQNPGWESN